MLSHVTHHSQPSESLPCKVKKTENNVSTNAFVPAKSLNVNWNSSLQVNQVNE